MKHWFIVSLLISLFSCTSVPENVKPVDNFDLSKYLGTWYEIARLDHSFERNMNQVSANYAIADDKSVIVLNRGFDTKKQAWRQSKGQAVFVDNSSIGHLKVSFFGPFYSSYVIFYLDADYQYAFVSGYNHDYLWLLSRQPQVPESIKQKFIQMSANLGFATEQLIWVEHRAQQLKFTVN
ncbi:lipocalin family protein [Thalassotalea ponticola]|uniref:lipocalin family protein n=1 Tax=Thalassotalea ponticola TaxID=1523392 RepID=UPI0025B48BB1|nr:lipocalin family protein [Thalassotalea ponticola]MDN3651936.1 lipocalin family protein [Thalassotalea ponticola]